MPISVMPTCTVERKLGRILGELQRPRRAAAAGLGHGLEPRPPGGDDGELGHGEEAVQHDEHQHDHDGKKHSPPLSRAIRFLHRGRTRAAGASGGIGGAVRREEAATRAACDSG